MRDRELVLNQLTAAILAVAIPRNITLAAETGKPKLRGGEAPGTSSVVNGYFRRS